VRCELCSMECAISCLAAVAGTGASVLMAGMHKTTTSIIAVEVIARYGYLRISLDT